MSVWRPVQLQRWPQVMLLPWTSEQLKCRQVGLFVSCAAAGQRHMQERQPWLRLRADALVNSVHLSPHIRAHVSCAPPRTRYVFLSVESPPTPRFDTSREYNQPNLPPYYRSTRVQPNVLCCYETLTFHQTGGFVLRDMNSDIEGFDADLNHLSRRRAARSRCMPTVEIK